MRERERMRDRENERMRDRERKTDCSASVVVITWAFSDGDGFITNRAQGFYREPMQTSMSAFSRLLLTKRFSVCARAVHAGVCTRDALMLWWIMNQQFTRYKQTNMNKAIYGDIAILHIWTP